MAIGTPGAALTERHREQRFNEAAFDPAHSLINYAEQPRHNDWSLRSALVRFAQPHPELVSGLTGAIRRVDAATQPARSSLFKRLGPADRDLTLASIADTPTGPYTDTRVADLGRLCAQITDDAYNVGTTATELLGHYSVATAQPDAPELSELEATAVPLLAVAARLEQLATLLTAWADSDLQDPPIDQAETTLRWAGDALDALEVPTP